MSQHKRHFKHILFFIFFHVLISIYQCYGTELKCTCKSNSTTFCPACQANLDFYFHDESEENLSRDQKVRTSMMQFVKIIKACEENLSTDPHDQKSTNENDTNVELCEIHEEDSISLQTFSETCEENLDLHSHDLKITNKTDTNDELCEKYIENSINHENFNEACDETLDIYSHDQTFTNKPETVYEAFEDNLSLYTHAQNYTNKYDDADDAICEKCEENSEKYCYLTINMKRQTLCVRCSVEYLSYYFSRNPIESTKLYCVEIILDIISDDALRKETKIAINNSINKKFNKKLQVLEERKQNQESCNLFPIINEILSQFKQKSLNRRICANKNCKEARFDLIQVPCCKQLMCLICICVLFETKQPKCMMCENGYICQNMQEFEKTFKSIYLCFAEQAPKLITKEIQKEFDNAILKIRKSKKNGSMQYTQFAALTKKWLSPARKILFANPNLVPDEYNAVITLTIREMLLVMVITIAPQMTIFVSTTSLTKVSVDAIWFVINFEAVSLFEYRGTQKLFKNIKSKRISKASRDFVFTWLNILWCYFIFGPNFYEEITLTLFNFVLIPSILWPLHAILNSLNIIKDEDSYKFY